MIPHPHLYTLNLLRSLIESAPITFPKQRKNEMITVYDDLANNLAATDQEIEQGIIDFGKEIWPYREAYQTLYEEYGRADEEDELKKLLSDDLRPKYEKFLAEKGNIEKLRGAAVNLELYFTPDERAEIVQAELTAHDKIHKALERLVVGDKQEEYSKALENFRALQINLETKIHELRGLANRGEKWSTEILDKARVFETGFGYLERPVTLADVNGEIEYYMGVLGIGEE